MSITPDILDRTKRFEGNIPYMYLDTKGNVTVGVGLMLPNANAAVALPFKRNSDLLLASDIEKKAEWTTIKGLQFPHIATWYLPFTSMTLDQATIDQFLQSELEKVETSLQTHFVDYPIYSAKAQAGLIDMAYNLGVNGLLTKFPTFVAAVKAQEWETAAVECHRLDVQPDRNTEVELLFQEAASA